MMSNLSTIKRRPFPWRCTECRQKEVYGVTIDHATEIRHDGRDYQLQVANLEVGKCRHCGEIVFDDLAGDQIANALRCELNLLTPAQIRSGIEDLQMNQKTFARSIGVAEATVSRWCTGTLIQSRAMDNLIRGYFATPELRFALLQIEENPQIGATVNFGANQRLDQANP